jgi:hypothetical protein
VDAFRTGGDERRLVLSVSGVSLPVVDMARLSVVYHNFMRLRQRQVLVDSYAICLSHQMTLKIIKDYGICYLSNNPGGGWGRRDATPKASGQRPRLSDISLT